MSKKLTEVSKFLSYVLRHQPETIGLTLDSEGWAEISALLSCSSTKGNKLDLQMIHAVVVSSDKKGFAISPDGLKIRAVQGHFSEHVDISYEEKAPPALLYHGTATRFIESINEEGLVSGSRQYVHLSSDEATAQLVGQRHGKPKV